MKKKEKKIEGPTLLECLESEKKSQINNYISESFLCAKHYGIRYNDLQEKFDLIREIHV